MRDKIVILAVILGLLAVLVHPRAGAQELADSETYPGVVRVYTGEHPSGGWTVSDQNKEIAYLILHGLDWAQTRNIARNPDRWYETNIVLGEHPSVGRVDAYFLLTAVAHYAIAKNAAPKYRAIFQESTIALEIAVVGHNLSLGVDVKF